MSICMPHRWLILVPHVTSRHMANHLSLASRQKWYKRLPYILNVAAATLYCAFPSSKEGWTPRRGRKVDSGQYQRYWILQGELQSRELEESHGSAREEPQCRYQAVSLQTFEQWIKTTLCRFRIDNVCLCLQVIPLMNRGQLIDDAFKLARYWYFPNFTMIDFTYILFFSCIYYPSILGHLFITNYFGMLFHVVFFLKLLKWNKLNRVVLDQQLKTFKKTF